MARVLRKSDEVYLHCSACDITFRHTESECVSNNSPEYEQVIWESPCCTRRYTLEFAGDVYYIISLGWGSKKRRDQYNSLAYEDSHIGFIELQ